jgi:hypothetical protein
VSYLEPTYLRYVYDGLLRETLQADNAAGLPDGITGLYSTIFSEKENNTATRDHLFLFKLFAVLRGAVGKNEVFKISSGQINDESFTQFIGVYARFMNRNLEGKYSIYHERLRIFLLQRMTILEFLDLTRSIIKVLKNARKNSHPLYSYRINYLAEHVYSIAPYLGKEFDDNLLQETLDTSYFNDESDIALVVHKSSIKKMLLIDGFYYASGHFSTIAKYWQEHLSLVSDTIVANSRILFEKGLVNPYLQSVRMLSKPDKIYEHYIWTLLISVFAVRKDLDLIKDYCASFNIISDLLPDNFKWNVHTNLGENILFELIRYLESNDICIRFITEKGDFSEPCLSNKLSHPDCRLKASFFLRLVADYDEVERSNILLSVYKKYRGEKNSQDLENSIDALISDYEARFKLLVIKKGILVITEAEKSLLSKLEVESRLSLIIQFVESSMKVDHQSVIAYISNLKSKLSELLSEDYSSLTEKEIKMEFDKLNQRRVSFNTLMIKLLMKFKNPVRAIVLETSEIIEGITNGSFKAQSSIFFLDVIREIDDDEVREIAKQVNRKIPRIRAGALNYGQFITDNQLDLANEFIKSNFKNKAVKTLNEIETLIPSTADLAKRDQQYIRLLKLNKAIKRSRVCLRILNKIKSDDYKIMAFDELMNSQMAISVNMIKKQLNSTKQSLWMIKRLMNESPVRNYKNILPQDYWNYITIMNRGVSPVQIGDFHRPKPGTVKVNTKNSKYFSFEQGKILVTTDNVLRKSTKTLPPLLDYRLNLNVSRREEMTTYEQYVSKIIGDKIKVKGKIEEAIPEVLVINNGGKSRVLGKLLLHISSDDILSFDQLLSKLESISDHNMITLISKIRGRDNSDEFINTLVKKFNFENVRRCYMSVLKKNCFELEKINLGIETEYFLSESIEDRDLLTRLSSNVL